ncbi:hypothetical protein ACFC26_43920 [Kitasatospora purpeofusca]|uniref:hypothetical protein n=1 Tax=Kitasatospora purpeofusca TaxID=67352 RepID=UPI0035DE44C4
MPAGTFQILAGDLHRALWRGGAVALDRYAGDVACLGTTVEEYASRLRAVHELLTLPYVYWAPVTKEAALRTREWTKIGPLCDDAEAERHRARLVAGPAPCWVWVTREPDDGANSPVPRALVVAFDSTDGARELHPQLRGPVDMSRHEARGRAFAVLAVPEMMSRPLTAEQFRGAHWLGREELPATGEELRELLLRCGYMAGLVGPGGADRPGGPRGCAAGRDVGGAELCEVRWLELFAHWRDQRAPSDNQNQQRLNIWVN